MGVLGKYTMYTGFGAWFRNLSVWGLVFKYFVYKLVELCTRMCIMKPYKARISDLYTMYTKYTKNFYVYALGVSAHNYCRVVYIRSWNELHHQIEFYSTIPP